MLSDLHHFEAYENQLTSLNLNQNGQLDWVRVQNNQLTELHLQNGNNTNLVPAQFDTRNNPNLYCIFVDDVTWCSQNLTNIDAQTHFVANQTECDAVSINDNEPYNFEIFPNPVKDRLYIETDNFISYKIYNLQGRLLQEGNLNAGYIPVNILEKGMYVIEIFDKKHFDIKSFIKK